MAGLNRHTEVAWRSACFAYCVCVCVYVCSDCYADRWVGGCGYSLQRRQSKTFRVQNQSDRMSFSVPFDWFHWWVSVFHRLDRLSVPSGSNCAYYTAVLHEYGSTYAQFEKRNKSSRKRFIICTFKINLQGDISLFPPDLSPPFSCLNLVKSCAGITLIFTGCAETVQRSRVNPLGPSIASALLSVGLKNVIFMKMVTDATAGI